MVEESHFGKVLGGLIGGLTRDAIYLSARRRGKKDLVNERGNGRAADVDVYWACFPCVDVVVDECLI